MTIKNSSRISSLSLSLRFFKSLRLVCVRRNKIRISNRHFIVLETEDTYPLISPTNRRLAIPAANSLRPIPRNGKRSPERESSESSAKGTYVCAQEHEDILAGENNVRWHRFRTSFVRLIPRAGRGKSPACCTSTNPVGMHCVRHNIP